MTAETLDAHASELCRIFLGWKLREDFDALLALEEGALSIDILSGEAWCDGEPIPPLFIAGELQSWLRKQLETDGIPESSIRAVRIDALFAARRTRRQGREIPTLKLSCRSRISSDSGDHEAEANNG